jgi:hypothetical protein
MSYDDGSLGQRGNGTPGDGQSQRGPLWNLRSGIRTVVQRIRRHAVDWPRRYVEQQSALYESRDRR